ncbi:MAG: hypothetical protein ACLQFW_08140 [Xanthobacteraceae bacterium]
MTRAPIRRWRRTQGEVAHRRRSIAACMTSPAYGHGHAHGACRPRAASSIRRCLDAAAFDPSPAAGGGASCERRRVPLSNVTLLHHSIFCIVPFSASLHLLHRSIFCIRFLHRTIFCIVLFSHRFAARAKTANCAGSNSRRAKASAPFVYFNNLTFNLWRVSMNRIPGAF